MSFGIKDDEKTAVFIDGANLFATAKAIGSEIDYRKVRDHFDQKSRMLRAHYYSAILESDESDHIAIRPLIDWLDYNGWAVSTKLAKEYVDDCGRRKIKGSMNMEMAVDMIDVADKVDHVIMFSGDGDFTPAVNAVQQRGAKVTCVSTLRSSVPMIADELRRHVDCFVDLASVIQIIGREPRTMARAPFARAN